VQPKSRSSRQRVCGLYAAGAPTIKKLSKSPPPTRSINRLVACGC
jgi:hypothetical protein